MNLPDQLKTHVTVHLSNTTSVVEQPEYISKPLLITPAPILAIYREEHVGQKSKNCKFQETRKGILVSHTYEKSTFI